MEVSDWDRLTLLFRRPCPELLALVEVADRDQVQTAIRSLQGLSDNAHIYSPTTLDFREPLDWLANTTERGARLMSGLVVHTDPETFWYWANGQRERWCCPLDKVVFVLTVEEADDMCRHAPMLWEWVSLKYYISPEVK